MNETEKTITKELDHVRDAATGIAADFVKVGAAWARHGLTIGESVLKTSAETLHATARALSRVAEGLNKE